jgi:hypothetical protein
LVDFDGSDNEDDPNGMKKLQEVNFRWAGIHCNKMDYSSPNAAAQALEQSKSRISDLLQEARNTQVHSFKQAMGQLIHEDTMVSNMPRIRITASKNNAKKSVINK